MSYRTLRQKIGKLDFIKIKSFVLKIPTRKLKDNLLNRREDLQIVYLIGE